MSPKQRRKVFYTKSGDKVVLPTFVEDGIASLITRKRPVDFVSVVQELRALRSLLARARRGADDAVLPEQASVRAVFLTVLEREVAYLEQALQRAKEEGKKQRSVWEVEMKEKGYVLDREVVSGWDAKDARDEAWERAMLGEDGSGVGEFAGSSDESVVEAGMTEDEVRERRQKNALSRRYESLLAGEGAEPFKETYADHAVGVPDIGKSEWHAIRKGTQFLAKHRTRL